LYFEINYQVFLPDTGISVYFLKTVFSPPLVLLIWLRFAEIIIYFFFIYMLGLSKKSHMFAKH